MYARDVHRQQVTSQTTGNEHLIARNKVHPRCAQMSLADHEERERETVREREIDEVEKNDFFFSEPYNLTFLFESENSL